MAFLGQQFDATQVEPAQDFAPLPSGEYLVMVTDSEMKATKARTGHYLELTYQVIDGPMKGRLVWERLNLENPSAKAVEIAQKQLSSLCHAVGVMQVQDSQQLHNKPLVIRVEFVKADGQKQTRDSNDVMAHKKLEGSTAQVGTSAPAANGYANASQSTPAARAPAPVAGVPPWANKPAA